MGKPLISDAQMLSVHRTMVHLRSEVQPGSREGWPIAVLAAALLQLGTQDVLVTEGEQWEAHSVLQQGQQGSFHPDALPHTVHSSERASVAVLAAGYALAQSHYSHPHDHAPVTLALLQPGTPVQEAMRLAGQNLLPLILILILREEPGRPRAAVSAPENVEIIQVDAEDAIAICRVMQESLVRTRNRWGSVVLRAVTLPGSVGPIEALEAHLLRRGILK